MTPKELQSSEQRTAFRRELLVGAEEARSLMFRMNSYGGGLDWGFTPTELGKYGGYWLAQEALIQILTEYLGGRPEAESLVTHVVENHESVEYNLRRLGLHHTMRGIYFSATVTTLDGSDTTDDGSECEPGRGYYVEQGWVDTSWSWSEVQVGPREDAVPHVWEESPFDPEDPSTDPVLWLVEEINNELGGIEEGSDGRSMYSPGVKTFEGESISVRGAAHPFGFTEEELARALEILNGPKAV